jgi:ABC-type sugar transport system ATPase subunit
MTTVEWIGNPDELQGTAAADVLRVEHIAKRFGPVIALRDINLHLRQGEP